MSTTSVSDTSAPQPQTYRFGAVIPKLVYLAFSLAVTWLGAVLLWEPLGAMLLGESTEARVEEIRRIEPGQPVRVFDYNREYAPETNLAVTFQHYVSITLDDQTVLHRISVDSRKAPIANYNVNDKLHVAYRTDDLRRLAYVIGDARTWGAGALFGSVGLTMLFTAVPMLLAVRRPIIVDAEAPAKPAAPPLP